MALNLTDYFDVVTEPMDLGTICSQIEQHEITSKEEFAAKMRLVFENALKYNAPKSEV